MTYLPQSDNELITLACWASNAVGHQAIPCLIHILPASKYIINTIMLPIIFAAAAATKLYTCHTAFYVISFLRLRKQCVGSTKNKTEI